jgi:hypothetical protein
MKDNIPLYILTFAMLVMAAYLRSPLVCISIVALWGTFAAQNIMTRKNRDADITDMMATLAAHKAQMSLLTKDITNVAERARVILGDIF